MQISFSYFMLWIVVVVAAIGASYVLLVFLRNTLIRRFSKKFAFSRDTLLISLAKEAEELAEKEESAVTQKKDVKEAIAIAETLYANLTGSGFSLPGGAKKIISFFLGSDRHVAFEIVLNHGLIFFYVSTPHDLTDYVQQQIQAIYPNASVERVADYNIFQPNSVLASGYLSLTKSTVLPIRTYQHIDADPLDGMTNTLSKVAPHEGAAIQILVRPAHASHRNRAWKIAKKLHQGKSLREALGSQNSFWISVALAPFRLIEMIFDSLVLGKSNEEEKIKEKEKKDQKVFQKEEEIMKLIETNASKPWFETNIRIVCASDGKERSKELLRNIVSSFAQFRDHRTGNGFSLARPLLKNLLHTEFIYRNFSSPHTVVLSTEELASIYHFPLPMSETPNIAWLTSRKSSPPTNLPEEGLELGIASFRGKDVVVRMKRADRRRHLYIIGKSGMGKTVFLQRMAQQDIENGEGLCVVDPHGDLVNDLLGVIPPERVDDVIYFNPGDVDRPMGINMLEATTPEEMDFVTQEMIAIFYQLVTDPSMIGPMFEHNMRNAMLTLMSNKKDPGTIADIPRMFTDPEFQKHNLQFVTDPVVRSFWEQEMAKTSDYHKSEMLGYLISKVGRFVENSLMRNIIGQQKSSFDFFEVMNSKKILLVNLSKGLIGDTNSSLLGLMIVSKLTMAALRRASMSEEDRADFYLYIDEFQNYVTDSIATILSEARKYRLDLTIAHQYIAQLTRGADTKIKDAVLGNAGTIASFRIGIEDAEVIAKEFAPSVNAYDLVNAERNHAYIKLLVDNQATKAFAMRTIMFEKGDRELAEKIKELSRLKYGKERAIVESEIMRRTKLGHSLGSVDTHGSEASR